MLLVLLIFATMYCIICLDVVNPWLGGYQTAQGCFHLLTFTLLMSMALISYALTVTRDPGPVPAYDGLGSQPNDGLGDAECGDVDAGVKAKTTAVHVEVKRKGNGTAPRFCSKCLAYKPPRTHHCRQCRRCVLKMDHHCVWVANCVGHGNQKAFFLFLFYTTLSLVYALYLLISFGIDMLHQQAETKTSSFQSHRAPLPSIARPCFAGALLLPLSMGVGSLFAWHTRLVATNQTTIETYEGVRVRKTLASGETASASHSRVYDVGLWANVTSILGDNPPLWFVPWVGGPIGPGSAAGDGVRFPTRLDL